MRVTNAIPLECQLTTSHRFHHKLRRNTEGEISTALLASMSKLMPARAMATEAGSLALATALVSLRNMLPVITTKPTVCMMGAKGQAGLDVGTVRVFRQKFTLEDAIGSHARSLEANTRVTNDIPLGSSLLLPVDTVNCVQKLKG
jgi:hypothetical protein